MPDSFADDGASISGGQRQRLALARALLTRPAILLLHCAAVPPTARSSHDLSGSWHVAPSSSELERNGADPDLDDHHWLRLPVPGHCGQHPDWAEEQGLSYPRYTHQLDRGTEIETTSFEVEPEFPTGLFERR